MKLSILALAVVAMRVAAAPMVPREADTSAEVKRAPEPEGENVDITTTKLIYGIKRSPEPEGEDVDITTTKLIYGIKRSAEPEGEDVDITTTKLIYGI